MFLNDFDPDRITQSDMRKHDPTGSFSDSEIKGLMAIMNMPVTVWADMVRKGKATAAQLEEWMARLDGIKPGYGQLFLGDMLKSEEEHLKSGERKAVNYKMVDGKYVRCFGEPRTGMVPMDQVVMKTDKLEDEMEQLRRNAKAHQKKHAFDWVETEEPKTPEQLEAWKKLQDAKYEYLKTVVGNETPEQSSQ